MNVDCIVTIKPSSDSIKKIDGNILVDHLDRNEFKKITYPIYIQKNSLISYLRSTDCIWNLKDALKELTFIV
jgi:2-C-methyl-D-erythritol 4-phosphate cytidylyltransferase